MEIVIEYGVTPNTNEHAGGWLPVAIEKDSGYFYGNFAEKGLDKDFALFQAFKKAEKLAERFLGDYTIKFVEREFND